MGGSGNSRQSEDGEVLSGLLLSDLAQETIRSRTTGDLMEAPALGNGSLACTESGRQYQDCTVLGDLSMDFLLGNRGT